MTMTGSTAMALELAALREENARLRGELATESAERVRCRDGWATATRERDEARSAEAKARDESDLRDRLLMSIRSERDEARKQLTCIDLWLRRREPVVRESATLRSVQEFIERAEAEVARLEGLILDWDNEYTATDDWRRACELLEAEARRIRAQREEHQHRWFTFDETHVRCDGCGATQREESR